ncbi:MAG: hypothetical protein KA146_02755 [Leptospiraceae bacterium]|nr:hypothetical protein [Leptospiraceae bacterium]
MSELLDTTWIGDYESADITNATGWTIIRHPEFGACLINLSLDDEGVENILPLLDLLQNPIFPVAILNKKGKLDLKYFPSLVIGREYEAATIEEMISLINPETGLPPDRQSICITGNRQEAVSYILAGSDPTNSQSWIELRSRNILWTDIKENPIRFPLSQNDWNTIFIHEHKGKYAELDINGKLSSSVITKFTLGSRHKAISQGEMLSLSASPGDICTRLDFTPRKSFILYGDPGILDSWIYLEPPETGVESVNGQTGITFITPEDIGASPVDHVHEPPVIIKEVNGNHVKFRFEEASGDFSLYVNNALVAALQFGTIQTLAGEFCKIVREGNLLYWVNPETNEKLPFA